MKAESILRFAKPAATAVARIGPCPRRRLSGMRAVATLGAAVFLLGVAAPASAGLKAGDKVASFSLKTVDKGDTRSLEALGKGKKGTVVVFLSCKCPWVKKAKDPIAAVVKKYGKAVQFVGINANQNEALGEIKSDAAENFAFPMLRDEGSRIADKFAAERTPEFFLIDPTGVIQFHGGIDDLGPALGEFTAGKPITKANAKAFGCSIKRASNK